MNLGWFIHAMVHKNDHVPLHVFFISIYRNDVPFSGKHGGEKYLKCDRPDS